LFRRPRCYSVVALQNEQLWYCKSTNKQTCSELSVYLLHFIWQMDKSATWKDLQIIRWSFKIEAKASIHSLCIYCLCIPSTRTSPTPIFKGLVWSAYVLCCLSCAVLDTQSGLFECIKLTQGKRNKDPGEVTLPPHCTAVNRLHEEEKV
jgi:hypothetical protein